MSDSPAQIYGTFSFSNVSTQSNTNTIATQRRYVSSGAVDRIEYWANLDPTAVAQETRINLGGSIAADTVNQVLLTDADGNVDHYIDRVKSGDTFATVTRRLAALVGSSDEVTAVATTGASSGTINLISSLPGRSFTVAVSQLSGFTGATTLSAPVTTVTSSAAATQKLRKINEVAVTWAASTDADQSNQATIIWNSYAGGAGTAPTASNSRNLGDQKHPSSIASIITAQA